MRDYAVVKPQFWTGETGRRLRNKGPEALLVGMYLMTCPNSTMLGLFYLPIVTIAHETGLTLEGARKGLQGAAEVDFARYDPASETVWVLEMASYQVAETLKPRDHRWTGVVRELATWRKSPFFADFVARYKVPYNLPDNLAPKPLASPSEAKIKIMNKIRNKNKINSPQPPLWGLSKLASRIRPLPGQRPPRSPNQRG